MSASSLISVTSGAGISSIHATLKSAGAVPVGGVSSKEIVRELVFVHPLTSVPVTL